MNSENKKEISFQGTQEIDISNTKTMELSENELIDLAAVHILREHRAAFKELAR